MATQFQLLDKAGHELARVDTLEDAISQAAGATRLVDTETGQRYYWIERENKWHPIGRT